MGIQLNDIDYFLAVAEEGQVHRAAKRLGVSQPAVTKGLQRLESAMGFQLFERSVKGMTLTRVAEQFRLRTSALRGVLSDAVKEATDLHVGSLGLLRVGVSPLYIEKLFVPAFVQLHQQRPAATVRASVHLNDELWRLIRKGELDLAISSLPDRLPDDLTSIELFDDDLCMVVRDEHPLLRKRKLKLSDLADAQWMLPGAEVSARRHVEMQFAQAGLQVPKIVLQVNNTASQMRQVLAETDLVSLLTDSMLVGKLGKGLTVLPLPQARMRRVVGITRLKSAPLQPITSRFVELLTQCATQLRSA